MKVTKEGKFKIGEYLGKTVNQSFPFSYMSFETMEDARNEWAEKDILTLINDTEQSKGRSNEYQRKVTELELRPDPNLPSVMREQQLKLYVKQGISREVAEKQLDALLAAVKKEA